MSWITCHFHPGFAEDLTSWTIVIQRDGKLVQRVNLWPDRSTVEHRTMLSAEQIDQLADLVRAVDFAVLGDPKKRTCAIDDAAEVRVSVKDDATTAEFTAPLLQWAWARDQGHRDTLPTFDFEPALYLWNSINRWSPHRF